MKEFHDNHDDMCKFIAQIFYELGYKIETINGSVTRSKYRITTPDIIMEKDNKKIAVEWGDMKGGNSRILILFKDFDVVFHIPRMHPFMMVFVYNKEEYNFLKIEKGCSEKLAVCIEEKEGLESKNNFYHNELEVCRTYIKKLERDCIKMKDLEYQLNSYEKKLEEERINKKKIEYIYGIKWFCTECHIEYLIREDNLKIRERHYDFIAPHPVCTNCGTKLPRYEDLKTCIIQRTVVL